MFAFYQRVENICLRMFAVTLTGLELRGKSLKKSLIPKISKNSKDLKNVHRMIKIPKIKDSWKSKKIFANLSKISKVLESERFYNPRILYAIFGVISPRLEAFCLFDFELFSFINRSSLTRLRCLAFARTREII